MRKYIVRFVVCVSMALLFGPLLKLAGHREWYSVRLLLRGKGNVWHSFDPKDDRNPVWLTKGLADNAPVGEAGKLEVRELEDHIEAVELPVLVNQIEVDRILVMRFPQLEYSLSVHIDPDGGKEIGEWLNTLHAAAVINGSYYDSRHGPATPTISNGRSVGPRIYKATNGAFVSRPGGTEIVNLAATDWETAFTGADQAFVSYPLLVHDGKAVSNKANPKWLANRSFVGMDRRDRIVLGTTKSGFFSLPRLAEFLGNSPLELESALNLDGGPIACQAASTDKLSRDFCGESEVVTGQGKYFTLSPILKGQRMDLPIALAVTRRGLQ